MNEKKPWGQRYREKKAQFKTAAVISEGTKHFERNRERYIGVASGVVIAGITCLVMRERDAPLDTGGDGPETTTIRSFFFALSAKDSGNVVTAVHNGGRGHPGFRVHSKEHDIVFDSQGAASRAFGIPEAVMSKHLNGKFDNAHGMHFERVVA